MNPAANKYQIDMCHGPLFGKIVIFVLPLMLSNVMQLMFNAVDLVIVGQYANYESMAAVGSCGALIALLLNLFYGLSVGANVLTARCIGARDKKMVSHSVHTAMAVALFGGILMAVIGVLIAKPVLEMMLTPANVLAKSSVYMQIYCAGIPFILLYNFGSSILRATGDTRRPMRYMIIAGVIKLCINLLFVCVFRMDVVGVASATIIANFVSAALVIYAMTSVRDASRLFFKHIRFHASSFREIVMIGVPAGIQGALFSVSNIIIQSTINSFGAEAMAGSAATAALEGMVFMAYNSYFHCVTSFTGQNHGAGKYKRIIKGFIYCMILSSATALVLGWGMFLAGPRLLKVFNPDPEVIKWGMLRLKFLLTTYFLGAMMDVVSGTLRGLGHSFKPTFVTLMGICVFRVAWVEWIFPHYRTMENLLISYPISWVLVAAVNGIILYYVCRKMFRNVVAGRHPHFGTITANHASN